MKNPLLDADFLKELDSCKEHEVYAKIIALTFEEKPTEEITGRVTSGSVNIDGTSAVRRSCSVGLVAKDVNINDFYWGLNTKFELYVGLKNNIDPTYPDIIWFKQGIFLITSFSTSLSANGYTINISGKDKMCLLNGDIGGSINSLSVDFGKYDEIDADGNTVTYDYPLKEIILEAVHQYAGEPYHNIIVEDLDDQGFELMEYRGDVDLYMLINVESGDVTNIRFNEADPQKKELLKYYIYDTQEQSYTKNTIYLNSPNFEYDSRIASLDFILDDTPTHVYAMDDTSQNPIVYTVARIRYGDTCGYRLTELTFAGDLIGAAGNSITSILDKIVSMLGTYEYFYDTEGTFHFRRKKTYVNNSWNNIVNNRDEIYVDSAAYTSSYTYSFTDSNLVSAFNNTPDLSSLKNDFAIWGKRTSSSGSSIPIHLRYAIDHKPVYYKNYSGKIYLTQEEYDRIITSEAGGKDQFEDSIISTGDSMFHVTPIPKGISQDWWEIDDWARRYMYFADVDNEHDANYYLGLSSQELCDIVNQSKSPTAEERIKKTFNYYVFQLKQLQLGNFGKKWKSENWLASMPLPEGGSSSYYTSINNAAKLNQAYWVYLFDTALINGQEYIKSIEHGYTTTQSPDVYPTRAPGCSHVFAYALERKKMGAENFYHTYIYDPQIPDNIKTDTSFVDKIGSDETLTKLQNYEITDWREIIFQMQKDYFKYQHDEDFLATVANNNAEYYPEGYTGYEQYYIDINGFWRQLYNPEIQPIDLSSFKPENSNHYYIWDSSTNSFLPYTFKQATAIQPLDNRKTYFYYKGTKTLDTLIAIEKAKDDEIIAASSAKSRELKALDISQFKDTDDPQKWYDAAVKKITDKYDAIIQQQTASLNETNNGYQRRQFLDVRTITKKIDKTQEITYNYTLAKNLVNAFYPYYDQIDDSSWREYVPYIQHSDTTQYYKVAFMKDLTQGLSNKVSYFTKGFDAAGNATYTKWTATAEIEDRTASTDPIGNYPMKTVPSFKIGNKYYTYEGYEKVSALSVGEEGNEYYSYGSYKKPTSYIADVTYYERTMGNYVDDNYTWIFTPTKQRITERNYADYYINIPNPNAADKTICKGYTKILTLSKDITYYDLITDANGSTIASEPTYFTRGKSYYSKGENGLYNYEFTFEKGIVYYIYQGFKEVLDLTIDNDDNDKLSTGSFYYELSEDAQPIIINTDDNTAYFTAGKAYYGYYLVPNDKVVNGKYFINTDGNNTFSEHYVLRAFARGSTYYCYEEGYDLIDPYSGFDSETTYYVYDPESNATSPYITLDRLIDNFAKARPEQRLDSEGKLTVVAMNDLNSKYGIFVDENHNVYRLGQSFDFYVKQLRYRPVEYYTFAFYKQAVKYHPGEHYYKLQGSEYVAVDNIGMTQDDIDTGTYYILLDGYTVAERFNEEETYFIYDETAADKHSEVSSVTHDNFYKNTYYVKDPVQVYTTDEYNIDTHWTVRMENPELLTFWFDFLDIPDGDLAQYSIPAVGDRPKSVNDDNVKAIYYRDTPTVIFCGTDGVYIKVFVNKETFAAHHGMYYEKDNRGNYSVATTYSANKDYYRKMQPEDKQPGYTYIYLTDTIDNLFSISAQGKTAFDMLNNFLYTNAYCTESITMTTIPIYYLEPNTRIFVRDDRSGINGEYIVSKLTIPLQYNGTMQITATKAVDRII